MGPASGSGDLPRPSKGDAMSQKTAQGGPHAGFVSQNVDEARAFHAREQKKVTKAQRGLATLNES